MPARVEEERGLVDGKHLLLVGSGQATIDRSSG